MKRIALAATLAALVAGLAEAAAALAQPAAAPSCVDVKIGDTRYYECLNRRMEQTVPNRRFSTSDAPTGVQAPAPSVGSFSEAATAEQLGSNFGHSAQPQRPPAGVFSTPLIRSR